MSAIVQSDPVAGFDDRSVLARTLWAEARSQGVLGMIAVANVIANRAASPGWWGRNIRTVCLDHDQFSCWNPSDPQHAEIRAPHILSDVYLQADTIAQAQILGALKDVTNGADHYVAEYALKSTKWDDAYKPTFICGTAGSRHFFYRLGLEG